MNLQTSKPEAGLPLGIYTKSIHHQKLKRKQSTHAKLDHRGMRYSLQRAAQSLMYDREAMKQHRICSCCRNMCSEGVPVFRTLSGDDARFGNVIMCGSVWACPVCSAKITEKRRFELQEAIDTWVKKHGGNILLMTLTFPHEFNMPLADLLPLFAKALQKFKNCKKYKRIMEKYQRAGSVRSLEVTHGHNGWHPHTHDLIFLKDNALLQDSAAISDLKHEWMRILFKVGLDGNASVNDMLDHGLDIQGGDYAADYVAKFGHEPRLYEDWSAAREVTKGMSKIGGGAHATPFMLLSWYQNNGDIEAGARFREYVQQFDGKRMLFWSPGLKKLLAVAELEQSDEDIAAEEYQKPEEELVCRLTGDEWKLVLSRNARFEILLMAAKYGEDGVRALLEDLPERPYTHSGVFLDYQKWRGH